MWTLVTCERATQFELGQSGTSSVFRAARPWQTETAARGTRVVAGAPVIATRLCKPKQTALPAAAPATPGSQGPMDAFAYEASSRIDEDIRIGCDAGVSPERCGRRCGIR